MLVLALLALAAPVPGEVTRGFDPGRPYEGGRHRGVDLAAAPGAPVRAACAGPVVFAGRIAGDGIVTLRCGPWRVTHMPLATIAARGVVARGAVIGTVSASSRHAGLHLGVRRDGTRFGYVDPLRLMAMRTPPAPLGRAPRAARRRPPPPARPRSPGRRLVREPRVTPRIVRHGPPRPVRAPSPASPPLAPWPAWAGLALVLGGAGLRLRARRRACSNPVVSAAER
jgi:Peptidase family M23